MIANLFSENVFKILSFFSLSPGSKFNRNEIKERVMLNNIPLDKTLTFLLNSNILKTERKLYSINFDNEYSKLIYKENSDIDLAILNGKISNNFIDKLEKKYNAVIEIHLFDKDKFYNNKKDPLVKDIIKNGVKLI